MDFYPHNSVKFNSLDIVVAKSYLIQWSMGGGGVVFYNFVLKVKVNVQVFYSLISILKTYHRTLDFTPCSLVLFIRVPFQLPGEHTVLQPFRRIELIIHIAISVLPGTHFYLSQVKHSRVKCLAQRHTISTMSQY